MSKEFPHPFGDIAKKYRALRVKLPVQVSAMAVEEFKNNFKAQGYQDEAGENINWKLRKFIAKGARRALLIKTGRLRRGLRARPMYEYARVVNDVPYAEAQNEGARIRGTVRVRAFRRGRVTVRAHTRKVNFTIPARPFMVTSKRLMDRIEKHVFDELEKIFK